MIDRALAHDLRTLDGLLMAELVGHQATRDAAQRLGVITAAHLDGVDHADPSPDRFVMAEPKSSVLRAMERRFGLVSVDRLIVLLALAIEIDGRYAAVFGALDGGTGGGRPTVALAQQLARRHAGVDVSVVERLLPSRPLGRYGLVTVDGAPGASHRCIAVPADVIEWFADGAPSTSVTSETIADLSLDQATTDRLDAASRWISLQPTWTLWVHGPPGSGRAAAARAVISSGGRRCMTVNSAALAERGTPALLRAAAWDEAVLLVEDVEAGDADGVRRLAQTPAPLAVTSRAGVLTALLAEQRPCLDLAIEPRTKEERAEIWAKCLGDAIAEVDVAAVAVRYRLGPSRIAMASRRAIDASRAAHRPVDRASIDLACRDLVVGRLSDLATRLDVAGAGEALVLAPGAARELDLATSWARLGPTALAERGPALIGSPAEHLVCLFHGPPGTGKTLGARALAERLRIDAFRVDLSQLVSKWIGETEKNLARLFDEAEAANAVLFFDEADALFARRTDVRDAHDKYANVEAGYLLQRIEEHRGVVVLATNFRRNLDGALIRRCQVMVEFALPRAEQRREIWRRCLGAAAATIDIDFLASRFELSGGDIRNAAITAFVLGAERGNGATMDDAVIGTCRELGKAGRITRPEDFGPWSSVALAYAQHGRSSDPVELGHSATGRRTENTAPLPSALSTQIEPP